MGKTIEVKPLQPWNALFPIAVTPSGMIIKVKPAQRLNAPSPIEVTLPSAGIILLRQPAIKVFFAVSIRQLPALWYWGLFSATVIEVKLLQSANAPVLIAVTLSEMAIEVKPLQQENAYSPIDVTLPGMAIEVKPVQQENANPPIEVTGLF